MKNKIILIAMFLMLLLPAVSAYSDSAYLEDYSLKTSYESAVSGEVFNLDVEMTNDGDSEKNLTLEFDPEDPFRLVSDEEEIFSLQPGNSGSKNFRIRVEEDTESKSYDLEFNLDDENDDWDDSFDIKVVSDSAEISTGEIVSFPKKILPGSENVKFSVKIKNKGRIGAEDLVAKLKLPEELKPSSSYSNIVHAGDLRSGGATLLDFYFDVEESVKNGVNATLNLDYEEEGEEKTENIDIKIPVFPVPQFKIMNIETLSEGINKGSSAKIKISLKNTGREDAEDVTLKVYEKNSQPFSFKEKSVYIGTLDKGETGEAVYEFDVESDAEIIPYLVDFQTRSVMGDSVIVDDVTAEISVSEKKIGLENYLIYGIIALVIITGILIFLVRRS